MCNGTLQSNNLNNQTIKTINQTIKQSNNQTISEERAKQSNNQTISTIKQSPTSYGIYL